MPDVVLGIDPGKAGGLAVMSLAGDVIDVRVMPVVGSEVDIPELAQHVRNVEAIYTLRLAAVEKIGARPGQGVCSMFTFGCGYGAVRGVLGALGVSVELVTPQTWQKHVIGGHSAKDTKTASVAYVTRRFPSVSLRATPRSRVAHDGMSDAVCISEYARRLAFGTKAAL